MKENISMVTPEQLAMEAQRKVSDHGLVKGGAEYVRDDESTEPRLRVTDKQIKEISDTHEREIMEAISEKIYLELLSEPNEMRTLFEDPKNDDKLYRFVWPKDESKDYKEELLEKRLQHYIYGIFGEGKVNAPRKDMFDDSAIKLGDNHKINIHDGKDEIYVDSPSAGELRIYELDFLQITTEDIEEIKQAIIDRMCEVMKTKILEPRNTPEVAGA
ncbi:MAG: hypothetical protein WCL23_01860 [Candidatus Moraniibacteriota bacterium]